MARAAPTHCRQARNRAFHSSRDDVRMSTGAFYLVKNLIPSEGLVVMWGPPKCGKSFWAFDLFMHIALGWEYRGLRVKGGPVFYCALEGQRGFTRRIEAYRRKHLKSKGAPFYLMSIPLDLIRDHKTLIASIREQCPAGVEPVAIVLDTLNRSLNGSESKDEDMAAYVRAADAIRAVFNCVVAIIHHCGVNVERPRGHTSLTGAADVQIAIKRDADKNVVATVEWSKDGPEDLEILSRLVEVDLGVDDDGDPINSLVIEPIGKPRASEVGKRSTKPPKANQAMLRALNKAILEVGERVTSNTIPRTIRVVSVDTWRRYAYQAGISPKNTEDSNRVAFDRAHRALINQDIVHAHNEYRWVLEPVAEQSSEQRGEHFPPF
jgi:hypothetical protein